MNRTQNIDLDENPTKSIVDACVPRYGENIAMSDSGMKFDRPKFSAKTPIIVILFCFIYIYSEASIRSTYDSQSYDRCLSRLL